MALTWNTPWLGINGFYNLRLPFSGPCLQNPSYFGPKIKLAEA